MGLTWLHRLRLAACGLQVFAGFMAMDATQRLAVPLVLFGGALVTGLSLRLTDGLAGRHGARRVLPWVLVLDMAVLSLELAATGGHANPFSVLYLVQVAVAAVVATPRTAAVITALASLAYAALFWFHWSFPLFESAGTVPLPGGGHRHDGPFAGQLRERWLAFTLTAALIAAFVSRLGRAFTDERLRADRSVQLARVAALSAGAAHEIRNPLATIQVATEELRDGLRALPGAGSMLDDAELVLREVGAVQAVLDRLARAGGDLMGEAPSVTGIAALLRHAAERVAAAPGRIAIEVQGERPVRLPVTACAEALAQLVRNGLEAAPDAAVTLSGNTVDGDLVLCVTDEGPGIPAEVMDGLGQPFRTTKAGRQGMGLGVFLVASLAEQLGGSLAVFSSLGRGARFVLRLPGRLEP